MAIIMNILLVHTITLWGIVLLYPNEASAFILQPSTRTGTSGTTTGSYTALFLAKVKTKKQKKKKVAAGTASSGGFGKQVAATASASGNGNKVIDDYAAFPALEPPVRQTLVPTPPSMTEEIESTGSLPIEIYDRLDQIYGFPNFNHETSLIGEGVEGSNNEGDNDDDDNFSFADLLAAPTPSPSISNTAGKSTATTNDAMDINALLAAATGGPVETVPTKGSSSSSSDQGDSSGDENAVAAALEMRTAISSLSPFEKFRVLHVDPLVLAVDDFFTEEECDRYVEMSLSPVDDASLQTRSKTVGKDANAKSQRTSTTWFHHYKKVPELMAKASRLIGLDTIDRWEEPQTVRYQRNEKFTWHLDALAPKQATDDLGGQRLATLLVYLKEPESGGATMFRDLSLKVQPKKGSALLFFPAAGGIPNDPLDIRTLHCGEVVAETSETDKWISQLWLRAGRYSPTAPPGNLHGNALNDVKKYCHDASS